ncbi:hypothetical protein [Falsigemmobacter faecalis]|uniref:Elongation factor P n=1 Tax=Falsigemmobacter faecalis TaxID=2488730 RepID=A0A3P3DXJ8_9RHOB|nr:hypothetical protein [Falsigemmobacter faecalis]RRH78486.1 hypothetical protein EG244_00590 [Falsigemmobacter faecalis]
MKALALLLLLWPLSAEALPEGAFDCRWQEGETRRNIRLTLDRDGSFLLQSPRGVLLGAGRAESRKDGVIFLYAGSSTFPSGPGITFAFRLREKDGGLVPEEGQGLTCRPAAAK